MNSPPSSPKPAEPVLLLIAAAFLWSTGGLFIKAVDWNALAIASVRSAIAALTVFVLMPKARLRLTPLNVAGACAYTATVVLFVSATKLTTAANAIFLQYTAPVYVAVFGAWFLQEHPSRLDWVLIVVTLSGIGLFFLDQLSFSGFWGNICALASGLSFAALVLLLRKQKSGTPAQTVLLGNLTTALVFLPFAFGPLPGLKSWAGLLWLGVFQLGLAYVFYARAIQHVRALESTLISTIEPVLNPLWVMLLLGEKPALWALVGGAVVLSGATLRGVLTARARERRSRNATCQT